MLPARFLKGLLVKNGKHFNYLFGFLLYVLYAFFKKTGPMDTQEIISLIMPVRMLCGLKQMKMSYLGFLFSFVLFLVFKMF